MGRFREKITRFMCGRYGVDELGKFLLWTFVALTFVNIFVPGYPGMVFNLLRTAMAVYIIWRMFSRSIYKRRNENVKYCTVKNKIKAWFKLQKNKFRDRKTHVYKKCPYCKAVLRLKKIKGEHKAACPRCGKSFDIRI